MTKIIFSVLFLSFLASCGLNYTPPPTLENFAGKRKTNAENYVKDQFKDSTVTYQYLTFGQTTVVKPDNYKLLDSLFNLKYNNELRGVYDQKLEDQIGNQQQVVVRDTAKVYYIEHLVYAIDNNSTAEVSFADITMDKNATVTNFAITEQVTFPSNLLPYYKIYLVEESITHPGYLAAEDEHQFYDLYKARYQELPFAEKQDFLVHTLKLMELINKIKRLDKDLMIRAMCVSKIFARPYDPALDNFTTLDGVLVDNVLTEYIAVFTSNSKTYTARLSPFLEIMNIQAD